MSAAQDPAENPKVRAAHPARGPSGAGEKGSDMTYRERELETVRRLREELDKRQRSHRSDTPQTVELETREPADERAEVLFELICL